MTLAVDPLSFNMAALILILAFFAGLAFRTLGLPPLLGYLVAGFVCGAMSWGSFELLAPVADLGVTMLLFTIGLKLRTGVLFKPYIGGPALLHMILVIPLTTAVIMLAGSFYSPLSFDSVIAPWTLAFALSFSSTVFAIKIFDERGENNSFHAGIAIGILVIQDVLAVGFLVISAAEMPSPWALLLLLLPFTRSLWVPWLSRFMRVIGHGELHLLFGLTVAVAAYELLELMHLKGGLGALIAGVMLGVANAPRATELYNRLSSLKNLFLIGFFLQIGYYGFPSVSMVGIAAALVVLLALRPLIYFAFFTWLGLRARTATLAGTGLSTYSEFGLIVAAIAASQNLISTEWVVTIALAIAMSFFLATPLNKMIHPLYRRYAKRLQNYEKERLPEERIESLGDAEFVVMGMGRVGRGAYDYLCRQYGEGRVVGIEESYERTVSLREKGLACVHGDALDRDFWEQTHVAGRALILASLSNHRENLALVELARELDFKGTLAVTARYHDDARKLQELGCVAFNVYGDVGRGFAEHAVDSLPDPFAEPVVESATVSDADGITADGITVDGTTKPD